MRRACALSTRTRDPDIVPALLELAISTFPAIHPRSADITAITQLICRERESRDLALWERMRTCFWPDSLVRVSWFRGTGPDFVTGSIDMFRRGVPAKHRLGPILVTLSGDRAVATLSGIIDLPVNIQGVAGHALDSRAPSLSRRETRRPLGDFSVSTPSTSATS